MSPSFSRCTLAFFAVAAFLLVGCENKLTKENYDRIQVGMTIYQVTDILGEGEKQDKGGASRIAQDILGADISAATARQNANQAKQGLKDLTGPQGSTPQVDKPKSPRPPSGVPNAPVRDVFLWKSDKVEINVEFMDEKVVSKNQIGLD
ncbi:MAG: outer membrane protein assembly factor BamE [Phycisphaerales bacterium]|nr:outer membrane protein assembly factor BamE [Phycisphaerales bacterium]